MKLELTEKQVEALQYAITIAEGSYDGYSEEDLKFFDVKRDLLAWKQIIAKIEKAGR